MENHELKTVHELSELSGVSVRTLHYYDEIGLLPPTRVSEAGYRLYDENATERLQDIMLFRELEFSLKDIQGIMSSPAFDRRKALDGQIELLQLKRDRLDRLIRYAKGLRLKGEKDMSFEVFDKSRIESYKTLAREAWGDTDAYREYEEKSRDYTDTDVRRYAEGLMDIFYQFGELKGKDPAAPEVQIKVRELQDYISDKYYSCSNEILSGLGEMYCAGGDMTKNIDVAGGKGCADFVARAIEIYCAK